MATIPRRPWFVKQAIDAVEEAFRVVARELNHVLKQHDVDVRIKSDQCRESDSLRRAALKFSETLPELRRRNPDIPLENSHTFVATVGYINGKQHPRIDLRPDGLSIPGLFDEQLREIRTFLIESRSDWKPNDWRENIVDPCHQVLAEILSFLDTFTKQAKVPIKKPRRSKSQVLTGSDEKIAAALRTYHGFCGESLSCTQQEPISYRKLAGLSGTKPGKLQSEFFAKWLDGGNREYRRLCRESSSKPLAISIAKLDREGALKVLSFTANVITELQTKRDNADSED